jgi:hypothetical protein
LGHDRSRRGHLSIGRWVTPYGAMGGGANDQLDFWRGNSMSSLAGSKSREDMIKIANLFAALPVKPNPLVADEGRVKLGKAKADETLCAMYHLGEFTWQNQIPRVAQTLNEDDLDNLAHYIVSLR